MPEFRDIKRWGPTKLISQSTDRWNNSGFRDIKRWGPTKLFLEMYQLVRACSVTLKGGAPQNKNKNKKRQTKKGSVTLKGGAPQNAVAGVITAQLQKKFRDIKRWGPTKLFFHLWNRWLEKSSVTLKGGAPQNRADLNDRLTHARSVTLKGGAPQNRIAESEMRVRVMVP